MLHLQGHFVRARNKRADVGDDGRLLILLDLNGVLISRKSGSNNSANVRPGVGHLLLLLPFCRCGSACCSR